VRRVGIAVFVAGLFSLGVVVALHALMPLGEYRELTRAQRPGTKEFAVVHEIYHGDTVGMGYAVSSLSSEDVAGGRRGPKLWDSYEVEPARVVWSGRDSLAVVVDNHYGYRWSVHEHGRRGIRVRTVWVEPGVSSARP
jgi:hypothetical protein